jgi:hypothetical protein
MIHKSFFFLSILASFYCSAMQKDNSQKSLYEVLNVSENAPIEHIINSNQCYIWDYQNKQLTNYFGNKPEAPRDNFNVINFAFGVLANPYMREVYNLFGIREVQAIYVTSMHNFELLKKNVEVLHNFHDDQDMALINKDIEKSLQWLQFYIPYIFNTVAGKQILDFVWAHKQSPNINNDNSKIMYQMHTLQNNFIPESNQSIAASEDTIPNQAFYATVDHKNNSKYIEELFSCDTDIKILNDSSLSDESSNSELEICGDDPDSPMGDILIESTITLELTMQKISDVNKFFKQQSISTPDLYACLKLYSAFGKDLPIPQSLTLQRKMLDHYRKIAAHFLMQQNSNQALTTLKIARNLSWHHQLKQTNPEIYIFTDTIIHTILRKYHGKMVETIQKGTQSALRYSIEAKAILDNEIPLITSATTRYSCLTLLAKIYLCIAKKLKESNAYHSALGQITLTNDLIKTYNIDDKKLTKNLLALEEEINLIYSNNQ